MSISIIIPTYNRPDLCETQLRNIYSAIAKWLGTIAIDVTVLNNSSTCDYSSVRQACDRLGAHYHLSASNVGFNGNYCRAVCAGTGEYIWVISDDDIVNPAAADITLSLISSAEKPDMVTFSHYLDLSVFTGSLKDYIDICMKNNPLAISEFTLVTNLVYKRMLFDWPRFWHSEPLWFPHAHSVIGNALKRDSSIVVIGSKRLVFQTGNTEKERVANSQSNYNMMLREQFQRAVLEFINMCLKEATRDNKGLLTEDQYIQLVVKTFGCTPSSVIEGMGLIYSY